MKIKTFYYPIILFILYIIFGIITYGDHSMILVLTMISTFILSIHYLQNNTIKYPTYLIPLPLVILFLITSIYNSDFSRSITYIITLPICTTIAFFFLKNKLLGSLVIGVFILFTSFFLFPNLFALLAYKNIKTNQNLEFQLIDRSGNKINLSNNIIILDFWYSKCNICYEKFPELENLFLKYKNHDNIKIYSVNVPLKNETTESITKIVDSLNYEFPTLYTNSMTEVKQKLHINTYPHLLIINHGKVVYSGYPQMKKTIIVGNIENEIDKLLIKK